MQSLAHQFLTFCRSKPADEPYNFWSLDYDECGCAAGQFIHHLGLNKDDGDRVFDALHDMTLPFRGLGVDPHTFGALADRLEAHLKPKLPAHEAGKRLVEMGRG